MVYYAVSKGRTIGIFKTWAECNDSVKAVELNLYVTHKYSVSADKIPTVSEPVLQMLGTIKPNLGAGNVQFLFDLYESAATISSSSNTINSESGNTLPTLFG